MFVSLRKIPAKAADALDLMIEFATLGEYGLEYPDVPQHRMVESTCQPGRSRSKPSTRTERVRRHQPAETKRPERGRRGNCRAAQSTTLPEALLPPRIRLDIGA
ncbi:MAG: hypothetical protein WBP55_00845 [Solirubrobacterales bacterium]